MIPFSYYLLAYAVSVPIFFAIDMLWLGVVAVNVYQEKLGHLLGPVQWPVAIGFYLVFLVGVLIFATAPALAEQSVQKAIVLGGLFGFFTYATYELTNWATIKDWPASIVPIDILWGTVLSAAVAGLTVAVMRALWPL